MIINLKKSTLFTIDPDTRFSREYDLPKGVWTELWRRRQLLGYQAADMCEYFRIKTGREINRFAIYRWILNSEIYSKASVVMKRGVEVVNSDYFGEHEWEVVRLLTRNVKRSAQGKPKTLI